MHQQVRASRTPSAGSPDSRFRSRSRSPTPPLPLALDDADARPEPPDTPPPLAPAYAAAGSASGASSARSTPELVYAHPYPQPHPAAFHPSAKLSQSPELPYAAAPPPAPAHWSAGEPRAYAYAARDGPPSPASSGGSAYAPSQPVSPQSPAGYHHQYVGSSQSALHASKFESSPRESTPHSDHGCT